MQPLIMIHGINSQGPWFAQLENAFEPFFDLHPIRYHTYEKLGALKVAFDFGRRRSTLEVVLKGFNEATKAYSGPACLVAHSFGTVLAADLMGKFPFVQFYRIVFAGSPLSMFHNWGQLLENEPEKFVELRNETGGRDNVVGVGGGLVGFLRPSLGLAGVFGFFGRGIHKLQGPLMDCRTCAQGASDVRIHNAPLREYAHSDMFLSERHLADIWLPYLWGFVPEGYLRLLSLCQELSDAEHQGLAAEQDEVIKTLLTIPFPWRSSTKVPLSEYAGIAMAATANRSRKVLPQGRLHTMIKITVYGMCHSILAAQEERAKNRGKRNLHILRGQYPHYAINKAVKELVDNL